MKCSVLKKKSRNFLLPLCLVMVSQAATAGELVPTHFLRHGQVVPMKQDLSRMVLSTPEGDRSAQAFGRLENVPGHNLSVLSLDNKSPLPMNQEDWQRKANSVLENTGWAGPVFFSGDATTLPTGRIWIFTDSQKDSRHLEKELSSLGLQLEEKLRGRQSILVARPTAFCPNVVAFAVNLAQEHNIDAVPELMQRYRLSEVPSDTYYHLQWFLNNTGDNVLGAFSGAPMASLAGADIRAQDAWDLSMGSDTVSVAVIDSGVDCEHPELADKCLEGLNAITGESDASPPDPNLDMMAGHGTSVAGISAAPADGVGVVGVCPNCQIVPVRLIDTAQYLTDAMMLNAFVFATDSGAAVINNSWGPAAAGVFVPVSTGELEGMEYAGTNGRGGLGTVVASAAGNENQTTSLQSRFHTGLEHVICVAATNQFDLRSEYSNYGPHLTVAAPSNAIFMVPAIYTLEITGNGDVASNYTANFGGTSSATPVVSGVVGLIASAAPELTAVEIVQVLKDTADKIDPDGGFYDENGHSLKYGYGRVNALRALRVAMGQTDRPWCETPAAEEDCDVHLDNNCNGFVDEGCTLVPALGTVCEQAGDCAGDFPWECPVTGQQRGLCTLACISSPCPAGSTCVEGRCSLDCETSDDCPTDFVCNKQDLGNCVPTCQTSADCAEGETCDLTSFLCRLDTDGEIGSPCGVPEDCINDGFCLGAGMGFPDGYCTRSCDSHSDCGGINRCVFVGGHGNFCYMGCSFDGDCRTDYLCEQDGPRAGTCYKLCERDDQCTGGDPAWDTIICETESGRCIDTATEADGGVDGGEEDGGELDAGEVDAGEVDAGEVDAGEVDAGEVDAGEVDAGEEDAGEEDAGQDAGTSADADTDASGEVNDGGGGCGCGTQGSGSSDPLWFLLMMGLLVFTTSRKNRR